MSKLAGNTAQERARQVEQDPRWARVLACDASADGLFWYSVSTSGVYCRPSCKSRAPRPENVAFHLSPEAAEAAGFRACKRCKPDRGQPAASHSEQIIRACRLIEAATEAPSLDELAAQAGMSSFHFQRVFKAAVGLTPKQYAQAHRARRVRAGLEDKTVQVTDAIYDAGFGSNSRFYESADSILGMTATDYRRGGAAQDIRFAVGECSLGSILVACSDRGVCAVLLGDDAQALAEDLQDRFPKANLIGGDAGFETVVAQVVAHVESPATPLGLPLDIRGTAFQQRVWDALRKIPAGQTLTYSEVAERIGQPKSVRAVAGACAANAIGVVIPCHRVVRSDGSLSGYRWGIERKHALLLREGAIRESLV